MTLIDASNFQQPSCHTSRWITRTFKNSHSGNCIAENGICIIINTEKQQHLMYVDKKEISDQMTARIHSIVQDISTQDLHELYRSV